MQSYSRQSRVVFQRLWSILTAPCPKASLTFRPTQWSEGSHMSSQQAPLKSRFERFRLFTEADNTEPDGVVPLVAFRYFPSRARSLDADIYIHWLEGAIACMKVRLKDLNGYIPRKAENIVSSCFQPDKRVAPIGIPS